VFKSETTQYASLFGEPENRQPYLTIHRLMNSELGHQIKNRRKKLNLLHFSIFSEEKIT